MPIYEYHCDECDTTFEKFWRSANAARDNGSPTCPECSGTQASRVLSAFSSGGGSMGSDGGWSTSGGESASPFR